MNYYKIETLVPQFRSRNRVLPATHTLFCVSSSLMCSQYSNFYGNTLFAFV